MLRDLENHRSRHSQQRARGSITETTHRCPQTPLQPRSSGQSAPRSHRTLLPTDAQPQAHHRHVLQSTLRAIGANLRAGSSAGTGTHAEAGTREGTAALAALQRERCKLVGTERAAGCSAPQLVLDPPVSPQSRDWHPQRGRPGVLRSAGSEKAN